jgi:phosphoglycerate dehydrogenase-like enzyme
MVVMSRPPRIASLPELTPEWMLDAGVVGGAQVVAVDEADTVIWGGSVPPDRLGELIVEHGERLEWIQLPWAGVEPYLDLLDTDRVWTCAKGAYGDDVAEMVLALLLAGRRGNGAYARSTSWRQHGVIGANLHGARVCIVGGGGITEELVRLLEPFGVEITVVRRRVAPMHGVAEVVADDQLDRAITGADAVVLALALTPATEGLIDARRLELMGPSCWLVNVARGGHVVTDDLVDALERGVIAGAGLDVTEPEPLPDGHPLWELTNCIITPHVANTPEMLVPRLAARITENVRRRAAGEPLLGIVDPHAGY